MRAPFTMPGNRQVLIHIRGDGINMPSISRTAAAACIPHILHTFHLRFHVLFSIDLYISTPFDSRNVLCLVPDR